jgi:putative transposase
LKIKQTVLGRSLAHYTRILPNRDAGIAAPYASYGYTMQMIGDYFGLHYSRASGLVQAAEQSGPKAKVKPQAGRGAALR